MLDAGLDEGVLVEPDAGNGGPVEFVAEPAERGGLWSITATV